MMDEHAVSDGLSAPGVRRRRSTLGNVETDAELLGGLQRGDEQAFVMLVKRYQMPMLRLARSMVSDHAVAEEAVQDTWVGVIRGIDRFEGRSSLKTWLFHILVNRVRTARTIEYKRRPPRGPSVDPDHFNATGQWAEPVERWDEDVEERMDASAATAVLWNALDGLPERQRAIVVLRDVEGLSSEEACDVLGIKPGNQRILLHRGRAGLRQILAAEMKGA
jgi:RNA polymerase sigma-70 factor (ECF subfamily)